MRGFKHGLWGLGTLLLVGASLVFAAAARAEAPVPDAHGAIKEYKGPETCLTCHPNAGKEVAESLHYQQQGSAPFLDGFPQDKTAGMMVTY
jgi:hypothetical protein